MPATDEFRQAWIEVHPGHELLLTGMTGVERVSAPFQFDLHFYSESTEWLGAPGAKDELLGAAVAVAVELPNSAEPRYFHGYVTELSQVDVTPGVAEYRAVLRPWFWLLTRTADCRIFQKQSVLEIFESVVKEHKFGDYDTRRVRSAGQKKLEYCVQYRETDFNFLSRLLEQEGIHYFFRHERGRHVMVLADDLPSAGTVQGYEKVPYYPPTQAEVQRERDHLVSWSVGKTVQPGKYATIDFDFEKPDSTKSLLSVASVSNQHQQADFEVFDYPAEPAELTPAATERVAKTRIEELQSAHLVARGEGTAIGIAPGHAFELTLHLRDQFNRKYYVTGAAYSITQNSHATSDEDALLSRVTIEAVDAACTFRPQRLTPKPVIQGAQTATVVGKDGEEIFVDKYGRVKVQFHWDRKGKSDENSSCWIRVAQDWAGKKWGALHTPRVGQEVIVSFLEGDPDRPIITGRVYNGDQMPPYELPKEMTRSGIRTRSTKKGGEGNFNEIRFEDNKGSEQLFIHAEKDLLFEVENDATWNVGLDESSAAKGRKGVMNVTVGKTVTVDAGDEIKLVTGQSQIVMKKDGEITIECFKLIVKAEQLIDMKANQDVKVTAGVNLNAKAVQVEIKGDVSAKMDGAATVEVSSSGIATIKGSLTKIN